MGKTIRVASFEEMAKTAQKLRSISETYKEISDQLLQKSNTMGAAWEGADNLAFVEQINGFTEELKAMSAKLQEAGELLDTQVSNYKTVQEGLITEVKKLVN